VQGCLDSESNVASVGDPHTLQGADNAIDCMLRDILVPWLGVCLNLSDISGEGETVALKHAQVDHLI